MVKFLQKRVIDDINSNGKTDSLQQKKTEVDADIFKLLCYKSEVALVQSRYQEALDMVLLAKEMLPNFPKEGTFLSMLAYNFGVDLYQKRMFEESVIWLRESYELGKEQTSIGPKNQARTLRLLASAYLEWNTEDTAQKALHAVSLANAEYSHPAGLFLKLRILLETEASEEPVKKIVEDILRQPELSVDIGLNAVHLLVEYRRHQAGTDLIDDLVKRYENTPDLGKLLITKFEVLHDGPEQSKVKEFVETCITDHNTGRPLEPSVKKRFHIIFWEEAAKAFEKKCYEESLEWYNYSLSLFSRSESGDKNLAKLHRNRASCYLSLNIIDKATEAIQEAEKFDRTSVHTQYMIFKLALSNSNVEKAKDALQKMCECATDVDENPVNSDAHGLICLAAQLALENKYQDTAALALESLSNCSSDHLQVLTALRCLIRIKLDVIDQQQNLSIEKSGILHNLQTAYNKLLQLFEERKELSQQLFKESTWFMKIAWNIALKCEDQPEGMKNFFSLCGQFTELSPKDQGSLSRQKTCMMMAAAACLQCARTATDSGKKKFKLKLKYFPVISEPKGKDNTEILLLMYEFEAKVKLRDPEIEHLLEKALKMPNPDPKAFETMAELALSGAVGAGSKEEAWNYYNEVLDVIDKRAQGQYPEIEILWLMTRAVEFSGRYQDAEKWCSTSMKLLKHLGSMKGNYEEHVSNIYIHTLMSLC
ncbi:hypothetical protein FSP39_016603 [Pinctada imbricata]|uniref:Protein ZIP4 homolog n=1 Tax=Pinctada imbricata TaxID=66713 RepID=A0AA89C7L2_PINIB|nr:hypothetical protein FSP39_016603 [Pinctada imbricata]